MSVSLGIINFDELFSHSTNTPFILNDLLLNTVTERSAALELFYKTYSSELLSTLPSCRCGEISGEYNLGVHCSSCDTVCSSHFSNEADTGVWIRSPIGVNGLINPYVLLLLSDRFTKVSFDIIRYLTDTTYNPGTRMPTLVLDEIATLGIQRGYNYFVDNFFDVINKLFNLKSFRKKGDEKLLELFNSNKDCIISSYIPVPNKSLLIVEKNEVGTYIDPIILGAVDAISMITSLDVEPDRYKSSVKQNRTSKALFKLVDFYKDYVKSQISKKEGILRKHVYATRVHFSFRSVITTISGKHRHDEIHVPWFIGINVLRPHLINKMLKMGFDFNSAIGYLNAKAKKYDPLIEIIFNELISEAPSGKGIATLLNRNPTLAQGSIQRVYISKVKSNDTDNTISLPILSLTAFAGDLDGDALNGALLLDEYLEEECVGLAHYNTILSSKVPLTFSETLNYPKTLISSINSFYSDNCN